MIRFNCAQCGRELGVSDDKAGVKARCPGCGSLVRVPVRSAHLVVSDKASPVLKNEKLQQLYAYFLEHHGPKIVHHAVEEDEDGLDRLKIVLKTGEYQPRQQSLTVLLFEDETNPSLVLSSPSGLVAEDERALPILRLAELYPVVRPYIIANSNILAVGTIRPLNPLDGPEFSDLLIACAEFADKLEEVIMKYDFL